MAQMRPPTACVREALIHHNQYSILHPKNKNVSWNGRFPSRRIEIAIGVITRKNIATIISGETIEWSNSPNLNHIRFNGLRTFGKNVPKNANIKQAPSHNPVRPVPETADAAPKIKKKPAKTNPKDRSDPSFGSILALCYQVPCLDLPNQPQHLCSSSFYFISIYKKS